MSGSSIPICGCSGMGLYMNYDIVIIGGGASGLACAIFAMRAAARQGIHLSVIIVEKSTRVGKKLLATGNGTCNISNTKANVLRFHGSDPEFARPALEAFTPADTVRFFDSIGALCRAREDGRIYPVCVQASAVLDCLRAECAALGVEELCGDAVTHVTVNKNALHIELNNRSIAAKTVILCTGGAAAPALGGSVEAYDVAVKLGHTRTPLMPSIVQLTAEHPSLRAIKGIRVDAKITLELDEKPLASAEDELLFTDYGLSGPAAMQLSRYVSEWRLNKKGTLIALVDLMPWAGINDVTAWVADRALLSGRTNNELLTGLVNKRLGQTLLRCAGYESGAPVSALTTQDTERIAHIIKAWKIKITGTRGFSDAQVTAGGLSTSEFDSHTMQSALVPGLYAAGEVLDIDGDCGGYNLQWAWSSAFTASYAAFTAASGGKYLKGKDGGANA